MKFESKRIPPEQRSEFLRLARDRYTFAVSLDREDRTLAEEDVRFTAALPIKDAGTTQWQEQSARDRVANKRPVLTENRLPTFTAQVVNDGRQSKPAIKISPLDNGTKETAEFFQGRIRYVEYDCQADVAYDTCREQQVTCGRGFLRVTWGYIPGTMKKQAEIQAIPNQFSVVFGPSKKYDCSDAEYCFVIALITREEHERKYGKDTTAHVTNFTSDTNPAQGWLGAGPHAELIQEAEYWVKEYKKRTLCGLSNGKTYWEDELPEGLEQMGITIEETREEMDCTVVQYVIDGADILDETVCYGPYIGIVPLWGREFFIDGARRTSSLIRYAKDPQRLLNLYVSNIAEQIAQMPKTPYMVPVGGIPAGSERQYENLNNSPKAWIYYNPFNQNGQPLPPPTRQVAEPPIQALVAGYNQCVDAIKAAMGLFDASIGNISNETSGIAINSRKRESDNANFHFHDNEARTRNHVGRILLHLIVELDKGKGFRSVRTEDGKTRNIRVGEPWHDPELNKLITHTLDAQNYGVGVDTGPSFLSQRKEAVDAYGQIAKADKNFMSIAGDKFFRALDAPGSDEIADRYEKMLPPQLQPQKGKAPDPQAMQQQFQQMQSMATDMIDRLTAKVHELQSDIDNQVVQSASRERIAEMQEMTKRLIALGQMDQKDGITLLENELTAIKQRLETSQAAEDRQTKTAQADADRQQQQQQQQQAQQHASGMQDSAQAHEAGLQADAQSHAAQLQTDAQAHQVNLAQMQPPPAAPAAPTGQPPQE